MQGLVDLLCALPVDLKSGASDPHSARPSADSSCTDQGCLHRPIIMAHMQVLASTIDYCGGLCLFTSFPCCHLYCVQIPAKTADEPIKLNHFYWALRNSATTRTCSMTSFVAILSISLQAARKHARMPLGIARRLVKCLTAINLQYTSADVWPRLSQSLCRASYAELQSGLPLDSHMHCWKEANHLTYSNIHAESCNHAD